MLSSDDNNPQFTGARNPDDVLHVTFYVRSVQDNFRTEKEGRPIFHDEHFVKIVIPGRNDLDLDMPTTVEHQKRFPRQWMIFQNQQAGSTEQTAGTPVTEWPILTRAQAEELRGQKFYTVEQVANCSDGQIQALGMNATILRQKARVFLENAKDSALATQQALELEAKNKEIAELKAAQQAQGDQLAQMHAMISGMAAKPKKAAKKERKPMSEEARKAAGERLRAGRIAKLAQKTPEAVSG